MTLVESLRMEANTAAAAAQVNPSSLWCQGMKILAIKFNAAADEIERLEQHARDLSNEIFEYNDVTCVHERNPGKCPDGCALPPK